MRFLLFQAILLWFGVDEVNVYYAYYNILSYCLSVLVIAWTVLIYCMFVNLSKL